MDSGVRANWRGARSLQAELELMTLPPQRRRRAMALIGREVKKQARKNVRSQLDVKGRSFAERKKKRQRKGKMLSGFVRGKNLRQQTSPNAVTVGFRLDSMARAAQAHQSGQRQTMHAKAMSGKQIRSWKDFPATQKQAAAMNELGFRVERKGGKKKRVSQAWIMKNMTSYQALGVLYKLNGERQGKQSWVIALPAREFFPNDARWVRAMVTDVIRSELNKR